MNNMDSDDLIQDSNEALDSALRGVDRIRAVVNNLRTFSRLDESDLKAVDIHECIQSTLSVMKNKLEGVQVRLEMGELPQIQCHPAQISQALNALLQNAAEAIPGPGGCIIIETAFSRDFVVIRITDNGRGIDHDIAARIFDPFFTTKDVGQGTGVGLTLAFNIAAEHGGALNLTHSEPGKTCFELTLARQFPENKSSS